MLFSGRLNEAVLTRLGDVATFAIVVVQYPHETNARIGNNKEMR